MTGMASLRNNTDLQRFELEIDGQMAVAYYKLAPGVITLTHTETPMALRGRGIASQLVHGVLETARSQGLKVVPRCPFVSAYIAKHPEFGDLLL